MNEITVRLNLDTSDAMKALDELKKKASSINSNEYLSDELANLQYDVSRLMVERDRLRAENKMLEQCNRYMHHAITEHCNQCRIEQGVVSCSVNECAFGIALSQCKVVWKNN